MNLNDIPQIASALKSERTNKIKLLHKLLFTSDGDRKNRSRIRSFSSFPYCQTYSDFKTKVDKITANYSLIELNSIATILRIVINGTQAD